MENRKKEPENIINVFSRRNACKNIYVVDEKWVYMNDLQHANNLHKWVPLDGSGDQLRPMALRINNMTKKFNIVVVSNFNSNSYFEVLHVGGSINSKGSFVFAKMLLTV